MTFSVKEVLATLDDTIHRTQIGQTRIIIAAMELQAKRYAKGELPRVSPQMALQAFSEALRATVADTEAAHAAKQKAVTQ